MKTYEELICLLSADDEYVSHADKMETLQNRDHALNQEWQTRVDEAELRAKRIGELLMNSIATTNWQIDIARRDGWEAGIRAMADACPLPGVKRVADALLTKGPPG